MGRIRRGLLYLYGAAATAWFAFVVLGASVFGKAALYVVDDAGVEVHFVSIIDRYEFPEPGMRWTTLGVPYRIGDRASEALRSDTALLERSVDLAHWRRLLIKLIETLTLAAVPLLPLAVVALLRRRRASTSVSS